MLVSNEERQVNKGSQEEWWVTSMPKLRYWLGVEHVNIIKLDCEGCEVRDNDNPWIRFITHQCNLFYQ